MKEYRPGTALRGFAIREATVDIGRLSGFIPRDASTCREPKPGKERMSPSGDSGPQGHRDPRLAR